MVVAIALRAGATVAFPAAISLFAAGKAGLGPPVRAAVGAAPVGTINPLHPLFLLAGRDFTPYITMPARARNARFFNTIARRKSGFPPFAYFRPPCYNRSNL